MVEWNRMGWNETNMMSNSSSSSSSNSNNRRHHRKERGRRSGAAAEDDVELGLSIGGAASDTSLFVKVYMEGQPIGRKLNMMAHSGYDHLIATLDHMFNANIILFLDDDQHHYSQHHHVLTYQDDEGDWLMIGDVPWDLFLSSVKRLNISRAYPS